jgi:hypothetical protein
MTTITTATEFCSAAGKQVAYLVALVAERAVPNADAEDLMTAIRCGWLDQQAASEWIARFEALPKESDDV